MEIYHVVGVDISKSKFHAALLINNKQYSKAFDNTKEGFNKFSLWLKTKNASNSHICMEATGCYSEPFATYLFETNMKVSVVNPMRIKGFAQSKLLRTKNDEIDAKLIAQFCQTVQPKLWQPVSLPIKMLQAFVKRLDALLDLQTQERNRLEGAETDIAVLINQILDVIQQQIKHVEKQIHDIIKQHPKLQQQAKVLDSIQGLGERTISRILAFINPAHFKTAKQVTAFVGLNPRQYQSGTSVKGRTRLSKAGNKELRQALYFPAIVAMRYNPVIKAFCERLKQAGKPSMVIICAAMRKLLHIIYGVLKTGKSFNTELANNF